ncbi:XdhC family protein [Psychrobacter namhaensis]|uniref:XdhC family protein n=1 Tax=Psychrobacter namhaensis TaxID=292734 RepID=UPI003CFFD134
MNQIADILKLASEAQQQNVEAVLATVVRTDGSAYRRAGAMMLICEDGRSIGMISGGCLEPHIIKRAFWLARHGANVQVYQTGEDTEYTENGDPKEATQDNEKHKNEHEETELHDGLGDNRDSELDELNFGLGCNGRVHVLFERLATAQPLLDTITQVRQTQQPVTIATLIRSNGSQDQTSELKVGTRINLDDYRHSGKIAAFTSDNALTPAESDTPTNLNNVGAKLLECELFDNNAEYVVLSDAAVSTEWLIQRLRPQPRLLVCGAGNDVVPLVTMARLQDWHVTVVDSRIQYATRARFPQADRVIHLPLPSTEQLLKLSRNAAVALMSHSLSQDRARLAVLLEHPEHYRYMGQLGPRYRTERLINEISASKADPTTLAEGINKLHYPIGYKLGGDGPEALALGIMAQINAVMYQQTAPAEFLDTDPISEKVANATTASMAATNSDTATSLA